MRKAVSQICLQGSASQPRWLPMMPSRTRQAKASSRHLWASPATRRVQAKIIRSLLTSKTISTLTTMMIVTIRWAYIALTKRSASLKVSRVCVWIFNCWRTCSKLENLLDHCLGANTGIQLSGSLKGSTARQTNFLSKVVEEINEAFVW